MPLPRRSGCRTQWMPDAMDAPTQCMPRHIGLRASMGNKSFVSAIAWLVAICWTVLGSLGSLAADELDGIPTFERDVRPILKAKCFRCHGEGETPEGNLDLRLRRLLDQGGDSGPSLSPGLPDESVLLQRIVAGEMPPEEVEIRPTTEEIDTIRRWI